jgi:fructokinase
VIVVCGEALIDVIQNVDGTQRATPGGGPFNTARALARLGVPTAFLGRLSSDAYGRELAALLVADGVSLHLASTGPEQTTIAVADVDKAGVADYHFHVDGTSAPNLTADLLPEHLAPDVSALHLGSLGLVLEPMAETLLGLVEREREGRLVMIDPNIRRLLIPDRDYRERLGRAIASATIVKASESDLAWLYPGMEMEQAARALLSEGTPLGVVTLGADGAFAAHRDFQVSVKAPQVEVVNTIGAGDSFGAALLAWLYDHEAIRRDLFLDREQLEDALRYACLAAAITCSRPGADPPWKTELASASVSKGTPASTL